jgi:hypothetical protein
MIVNKMNFIFAAWVHGLVAISFLFQELYALAWFAGAAGYFAFTTIHALKKPTPKQVEPKGV